MKTEKLVEELLEYGPARIGDVAAVDRARSAASPNWGQYTQLLKSLNGTIHDLDDFYKANGYFGKGQQDEIEVALEKLSKVYKALGPVQSLVNSL
jgi:hypothetical protein